MSYKISTFPIQKLAEVVDIQSGFAFKSEQFLSDETQIPLVKGENLQQGYINWSTSKYWSKDEYDDLEKYHLIPGDIVLAMDRPWVSAGLKWSYIKDHDPASLLVQRVARLRAKKNLTQEYLRVLISSNYFSSYIQPIVTGVNVPHISAKQIGDFKAPVPDRGVQIKIAAVLASYDEKIENNKRRIELLDNLAEELYREWFIRMRFPNYQDSKFEKGIPLEWDFKKAEYFFSHVKGKSYKSDELTESMEDSKPFITLKSFNRGGGYRTEGLKRYTGKYREEQLVSEGDVVMAVTDMTQEREVVGRVARVPKLNQSEAVISLDVIKLVPLQISKTFLYCFMKYSGFGDYMKAFANGANVLHLKPDLVTQQKILMPPTYLREQFDKVVTPIHKKMNELSSANDTLEQTKLSLLPRLMSGKLSVADLDIKYPPCMRESK
ncbi:restriction endonuclease subunit S [Alteromonas macleodii]|uniref:restriction endonuclease subunit S n=1 Tax=Alteromonas macleodii TaxID=28108 RepID=UPI00365763E7